MRVSSILCRYVILWKQSYKQEENKDIMNLILNITLCLCWFSLVAQTVKNLPTIQETQVWSLGWADPLEKKMTTHSIFMPRESHGQRSLAGYSPWGARVGHDWAQAPHPYSKMQGSTSSPSRWAFSITWQGWSLLPSHRAVFISLLRHRSVGGSFSSSQSLNVIWTPSGGVLWRSNAMFLDGVMSLK